MGTFEDSGAIFRYHRDMIRMHGPRSSFALGWRDEQDQQLRFEALAGIGDLNGKTLLDAGCGYGDLYPFLSERFKLSHYYGIDQIPELFEEAIDTQAVLMVGNGLSQFYDFIIQNRLDAQIGKISADQAQKNIDSLFKTAKEIYTNDQSADKEWV